MLFSVFPREIGVPRDTVFFRRNINSKRQLMDYITKTNGNNDCYVSVYDTNPELLIDKVVIDIDNSNLHKALRDTIKITERIEDPYFVLCSGMKGFHIYILFEPERLRKDVSSLYIKEFQQRLTKGVGSVDPHLIGNTSAMIRIPQTINKKRYCTFLPSEFKNWNISEIFEWTTKQHEPELQGRNRYRTIEDAVGDVEAKSHKEPATPFSESNNIPTIEDLSLLIRPCIVKEMLHTEREGRGPHHIARINFVTELMFLGYTEEQVLNIFRLIHQKYDIPDFDEEMTLYQISYIFNRKLKPYACSKLKKELNCTNCGWYYFW